MTTNPTPEKTPEEEVLAISAEMKKLRRKYRKLSKQANSIALPYESEAEREKFHNILEEKLQVSNQLETLKSRRLYFRIGVILARIDATIAKHEELTQEAQERGLLG